MDFLLNFVTPAYSAHKTASLSSRPPREPAVHKTGEDADGVCSCSEGDVRGEKK